MAVSFYVWSFSASIFLIGAACLVLRRQMIAMILGLELMLNAANVNIVYYAVQSQDPRGLAVALLAIAAAAAEVVVGLTLVLALGSRGIRAETQEIRNLAG